MTNTLDLAPTTVVPEAREYAVIEAASERTGISAPAEPSETRLDGDVPVRHILRWQDDGGALAPGATAPAPEV